MDLLATVRKSGSRGGVNFSWDSVASSPHRSHYLGHSLKAPVGRWQQGKDLTWYSSSKEGLDGEGVEDAEVKRREEMRRVKEAEEEMMARVMGLPVSVRNATGANAVRGKMREGFEESGNNVAKKEVKEEDDVKKERREHREHREHKHRLRRDDRGRDDKERRERRHRDQSLSHDRRDRRDYDREERSDRGSRRERSRDYNDNRRERRRYRSRSRDHGHRSGHRSDHRSHKSSLI